jgi:hypothetical protein
MTSKFDTAPTSLTIRIISGIVILFDAGLFSASIFRPETLLPALLLGLLIVGCYLRAPVAYYASRGCLTVRFRWGRKDFGRIIGACMIDRNPGMSLRLFGNGGLFAGTGIFWNRTWGIFRAYVTTSKKSNLVFVETETSKVLISPVNATEFLDQFKIRELD